MRWSALILALLLLPALHPGTAEAEASDAPRFRIVMTLPEAGVDPMTSAPVDASRGGLVLVPFDPEALVARSTGPGAWPLDAAGRPIGWTFAPGSLQVTSQTGAPIASTFLPYALAPGARGGTLVLDLAAGAARDLALAFDSQERGWPAEPTHAPRLDLVAGPGMGVSTMARVPARSAANLVILSPDGGARVVVDKLPRGGTPTRISDVDVPALARVAIPSSAQAFDVRAVASRPVLFALELEGTIAPTYFHASTDLGLAGTRFALTPIGGTTSIDVIAVAGRASVRFIPAAGTPSEHVVAASTSRALVLPPGVSRLEASHPVIVVARGGPGVDADAFLTQGVSASGGPAADLVFAPRAAYHVAHADAPATIRAFPLASPAQSLSGRAGDPPRAAWISLASPSREPEPWAFTTRDAAVSVLVGETGYATLRGPRGERFEVANVARPAGATPREAPSGVVLTPFPETAITVESRAIDGTPLGAVTQVVSRPGSLDAAPDGGALFADGRITTVRLSKPGFAALATPSPHAAAFLPALPPLLEPAWGPLERQGALLSWAEPLKEASGKPGERVQVRVALENRGLDASGRPAPDDAELELRTVPGTCEAPWTSALAEAALAGIPSGGHREAIIAVEVPEDAKDGACAEFDLRAVSAVDSRVAANARVIVRARAAFEPHLVLLHAEGEAKAVSLRVPPGERASVIIALRNEGSASGEARIAFPQGPGYRATLALAEGPLADAASFAPFHVRVDAGAEVRLLFEVLAEPDADTPWDFLLQAVSVEDPLARDEASVVVAPLREAKLAARAEVRRVWPMPGGNASADIVIENAGSDVEVAVRVEGDLPDGWSVEVLPPRLLLRSPGATDAEGARLDRAVVRVEVRPPSAARVGETMIVPLSIVPTLDPSGAISIGLVASVANPYDVRVEAPPRIVAGPGDAGTAKLCLRTDEEAGVQLRSLTAPRGWRVATQGLPGRLVEGDCAAVSLSYLLDARAPAGDGMLTMAIVLDDGRSPSGERTIQVPTTTTREARFRVEGAPAAIDLARGESISRLVRVTNDGNVVGRLRSEVTTGPGLHARVAAATDALAAGEATEVTWTVVADANATGDREVTLRFSDVERVILVRLRDDAVAIEEARFETLDDGTTVLRVVLENRGRLASSALRVSVGRGEDAVVIDVPSIAPGARVERVLLAPPEGRGVVRVETAHTILAELALPAPRAEAPLPPWIVPLAIVPFVLRRRRP